MILYSRFSGVTNECPRCSAPFNRSHLLKENLLGIQLLCKKCTLRYELRNTEVQRKILRYSSAKDVQLESIDEVGPGDIIKRKLDKTSGNSVSLYHHYLCLDVDRDAGIIDAIDLNHDDAGSVVIETQELKIEELKKGSKVSRHSPLDCLPLEKIREKAKYYAEHPEAWLPKKYNPISNNCQHFANLLRTGEWNSEDVKFYANVSFSFLFFNFVLSPTLHILNKINGLIYHKKRSTRQNEKASTPTSFTSSTSF